MQDAYFEIDADGAVLIFDGINELPFVKQPNWPSGQEWAAGEGEAWAQQLILSITDENADFAGNSPDQPTIPKPVIILEEESQE
jgi:hypothetical protein